LRGLQRGQRHRWRRRAVVRRRRARPDRKLSRRVPDRRRLLRAGLGVLLARAAAGARVGDALGRWGAPIWPPKPPKRSERPGLTRALLYPPAPHARGAPAKPWHPSIFRQALSASRAILSGQIRASPLVLVHDLLQRPAA